MTTLAILLLLTMLLVSVNVGAGHRSAAWRADEAIDDAPGRDLYDRYFSDVEALTYAYLLQAPSDEEWLTAVKRSALALDKPRADTGADVNPTAHRRRGYLRLARPSRPLAPRSRRRTRTPVLLGGLAVLLTGTSAGVYFAAPLTSQRAAVTYTSAGTLTVSRNVSSLAYNPKGGQLAGSDGSFIRLWDLATLTLDNSLNNSASGDAIDMVVFSPDGRLLASSDDSYVRLWNPDTNKVTISYGPTVAVSHSAIGAMAFSPNGRLLAVGDGNSVKLWNIANDKMVRTYAPAGVSGDTGSGGVSSVAFSPDGITLAAGFGDGRTYLWDVTMGKLTATFSGDSSVTFSPNGSQLAVGDGNSVNLWKITAQAGAAALSDPVSGDVSMGVFSHDESTSVITYVNVHAFVYPTKWSVSLYRGPLLRSRS